MEAVIRGWVNYFAIAKGKSKMKELDELVRTRLRIAIWKQWKKPKTKRIHLIKLGIPKQKANEWSNSRKGYCRAAHSPILCGALNNEYLHGYDMLGSLTITIGKRNIRENFSNKPQYAERHVRWCERTGSELMATFLLDFLNH
ncbi:MAG: hypothetical protein M3Z56_01610 [Bacteroidota bacterium]|nr:hypothetical protein [Bacteroidota bacterium]